ncbi:uncharacterized protein LOC117282069, partial [Cryptotermes secundus]|uniref:uncharacterized protein LOC117282069 n=1 Tax=Cryptotermes secundus TaxID=105785 RepID=UPI001454D3DD
MYESSCSYQSALDLKRVSAACPPAMPAIKSEDCMSAGLSGTAGDWAAGCAYRFACNSSTFEQLKQSVEKAKAALQDRSSYLAASSAFSDLASSPFAPPPRNNAATQDPLQDARRDDTITSVSDKRTHSLEPHSQSRADKNSSHGHLTASSLSGLSSSKGYHSTTITESLRVTSKA